LAATWRLSVGVAGGQRLGLGNAVLELVGKGAALTDDAQTDAIFVQPPDLAAQGRHEQLHEDVDLGARAAPVLTAERKERQGRHPPAHAFLDYGAHTLDALTMTGRAR
jgi:hypothetical protein